MVAQLVQRTEFAAEQRIVDRRFVTIESNIAEIQRTLLEEVKGFKTALDTAVTRLEAADEKREDKRVSGVRQAVYAGIIPAIFLLLGFAVQIWIALRGS
ncbi:hypothetical protein ACIBEJ_48620 [Nonomuraea sp. NPDC050790]|uniref:hypothetical protein n=1 Tax=Nonomuraea sp. NPDC050790 TaxID=3364371 RepID=UPI0037B21E76